MVLQGGEGRTPVDAGPARRSRTQARLQRCHLCRPHPSAREEVAWPMTGICLVWPKQGGVDRNGTGAVADVSREVEVVQVEEQRNMPRFLFTAKGRSDYQVIYGFVDAETEGEASQQLSEAGYKKVRLLNGSGLA